ncbi:MAG: DsrE/DsrF/DrsH-like family protein [Deltaproteobacteria bacterium]|nr:DsrE/DsrF/DrsH-like family protein [Deltaproteobacteria bacterium]
MDQETSAYIEKAVQERLDQELEERVKAILKKEKGPDRAAIIASKGTLDMAYPPLILASTCAAMDIECQVFFTFYGLDIVNKHKYKNLKVPPIANPAMPVPMPNIIGMLPGMTAAATMMMNKWMKDQGVATIPELLEACIESDVKLIACQMTMDVMGIKRSDLIDDLEIGGAATFINYAAKSGITLFI